MPLADDYLANYMVGRLKKDKIDVIFDAANLADGSTFDGDELIVGNHRIKCDLVVNSKSRKGVMVPSDIEIATEDGFITTNEYFQTNYENIFAVGDINGKSPLCTCRFSTRSAYNQLHQRD